MEAQKLKVIYKKINQEYKQRTTGLFDNLTNEDVFRQHADLIVSIGTLLLARERKPFIIDENNKKILRFLLLYFNDSKEAENIYPGKGYKLHKSLILCGNVGVGKTLLMQVFADYLQQTGNPNAYYLSLIHI